MAGRLLIAGNWKMNKTLAEARALVAGLREGMQAHADAVAKVDVLIFPPATLLFPMAKAIADSPILMGAQNAHCEPEGAFTGEISAPMVADTGCAYLLVGHSERRHVFGEPGDLLAKKITAGLQAGLKVVYCVGETLDQREAGRTEEVVARQLEESLSDAIDPDRLVLAYEPVWAIGTGRTATPEQAQEVHAFARSRLTARHGRSIADRLRILYGGSVKPGNARELMSQPDLDGVLVGGASLSAKDFVDIILAGASIG